LGKRTGRPRGAPAGNSNRLTHGRYSSAARKRQAEVKARIAAAQIVIIRAQMVANARTALAGR